MSTRSHNRRTQTRALCTWKKLIDLRRPVAVILSALLHFLPEDAVAARTVRILRDAMLSGSYLVLSHGSHDGMPKELVAPILSLYEKSVSPFKFRMKDEVARFFEGFELVEPGIVAVPLWRPEGDEDILLDHPERSLTLGGVARKP
jgi:hypothetical protein